MTTMRFKIKYKLFLSFTLTMLVVLVMIALMMKWSFQRGFLNYINEAESQHLQTISIKLEQVYQLQNNWSVIQMNQHLWQQLFNSSNQRKPQASEMQFPVGHDPLDIGRRISLFDSNKKLIIGEVAEIAVNNQPIFVNGETVGYVSLAPLKNIQKQLDLSFVDKQVQTIYLIALGGLFISGIVGVLISYQLTRPIKQLLKGAETLITGDFKRRINVKTKDELALLADNFNTLAATLDQNQTQQRQWIADMSHELRTPLAILHGEIQAIEDGVRKFDKSSLQSLSSEVERLNKLIEDLYQLSLSDSGALRYQKEDFDMVALLNDRLNVFSERMRERHLSIRSNFPQMAVFYGDRQRFQQLFTNLLENTLRYTYSQGQVWIHCQVEADELIINLEDTKPAVPDVSIGLLFERLYRVDHSRNRDYGGGGLGLSICKSIVEAHGGTIEADHSTLGGLLVKIKLPLTTNN
ncbi:MAG: HAMP domain-containing protein [Methylococcaceae bacterium]|nr:HAMP domain-containing protein [Methylococcaceae bacterium]